MSAFPRRRARQAVQPGDVGTPKFPGVVIPEPVDERDPAPLPFPDIEDGRRRSRRWKITPEVQAAFAAMVEKRGLQVSAYAKVLNVSPGAIQAALAADPEFGEAVAMAKAVYVQTLEDAAFERGVDGVVQPTNIGGTMFEVRKFSDSLLRELLARHDPENWGKKIHVENTNNNPGTSVEDLTPEGRADLRQLLEREKARRASSLPAPNRLAPAPLVPNPAAEAEAGAEGAADA